jgi:hypothetical protein
MKPPRRKWLLRSAAAFTLVVAVPLLVSACGGRLDGDWRNADRSSAALAPAPSATPEAVVQVYAARAFNWRGIFAVHTWIAVKPEGALEYTVHEVLGWRARWGSSVVVSHQDLPDRKWYGAQPELLRELRGQAAAALIPQIEAAIASYPYAHRYVLWPGPNSNTFVAHVAREVPGLGVDLPPTAIGKDYLGDGRFFGPAPSHTGFQFSLFGLLGVLLAVEEGIELNLLSLGVGVDLGDLALRLPGVGHVGMR